MNVDDGRIEQRLATELDLGRRPVAVA